MSDSQCGKPACQPEIERFVHEAAEIGEPDAYSGRRNSKRFTEGMMIEVALHPQGAASPWSATMHNVSETGISFWSRRDLDVGQCVQMREFSPTRPHAWLRGRVRHKTRSVQGYLIGVVFAD